MQQVQVYHTRYLLTSNLSCRQNRNLSCRLQQVPLVGIDIGSNPAWVLVSWYCCHSNECGDWFLFTQLISPTDFFFPLKGASLLTTATFAKRMATLYYALRPSRVNILEEAGSICSDTGPTWAYLWAWMLSVTSILLYRRKKYINCHISRNWHFSRRPSRTSIRPMPSCGF